MKVPANITRSIGRAAIQAKKNSPHIFFAAGLTGVVAGGVMACKATLKLEDRLDDIREDLDTLHEAKESAVRDEKEIARLKGLVYGKGALALIRLYGPSVVVVGVGVGLLTGSHVQMHRRNQALSAALTAVTQAFNEYRDRVKEEIGEEREYDIYRGIRDIAEEDAVEHRGHHSPYARLFAEHNPQWQNSVEMNACFLRLQQQYANDRLRAHGHIFLNEVYDMLGMERSRIGSVVGWYWNGEGDNYVDFGIFGPVGDDYSAGVEKNVWLDFNVDGVIFDKI